MVMRVLFGCRIFGREMESEQASKKFKGLIEVLKVWKEGLATRG
jgi:hypothetical protein